MRQTVKNKSNICPQDSLESVKGKILSVERRFSLLCCLVTIILTSLLSTDKGRNKEYSSNIATYSWEDYINIMEGNVGY